MTTVPLKMKTISKYYLGGTEFDYCKEISEIHAEYNIESSEACVEAKIPPTTTRNGDYIISVRIRSDGAAILQTSCTCPRLYRCKHTYKVLCRNSRSDQQSLRGPSKAHLARVAKSREMEDTMKHASVYSILL